MFIRDYVKAGVLLEPVPFGIPITLKYDVEGHLEGISRSLDESGGEDLTLLLIETFLETKIAPLTISVKNGTTFVTGVLYNGKFTKSDGKVPECLVDSLICNFVEDPYSFKFYAGAMSSYGTTIHGAVPIRRWLQLAGFNVLPGYVIPAGLEEAKFRQFICTAQFEFKYPLISDYIIFDKTGWKHYNLGFTQHVVTNVSTYLDDNGCVLDELQFSDGTVLSSINHSDIVRCKVSDNACVVLDEDDKILYCDPSESSIVSDKFTCPYCGKIYTVPKYGDVLCEDKHCVSREYPALVHMLKTLGLPSIDHDKYDHIVKETITDFKRSDIFRLIDAKVNESLSTILSAVVYIPNSNINYDLFCSRCNNIIQSVQYYIHNPEKILVDLGLESRSSEYRPFMNWLKDHTNVQILEEVLSSDCITIEDQSLAIPNAAPMFRGCKVFITGMFLHGDSTRVASILKSYGADVVFDYSDDVSFVLVGDLHERENGAAIRKARSQHKQIHNESEFFRRYDIDFDLKHNL